MEIRNTSLERINDLIRVSVMGFETKNQQPTCVGLGYRVWNPRLTVEVVGSSGGGSVTGECAGLSGLLSLLDSPIVDIVDFL